MMTISPNMGAAMTQAVDRANNDPAYLRQRIAYLEEQIEMLKARIARSNGASPSHAEDLYIPVSEFARRHSVHISTINRRFHQGKLCGVQKSNGHIMILSSEVYSKHSRK